MNTLVHADYSARASILVVKDPSGFMFRNPGLMRVPIEQALRGGESDCRNRTLHQMFLMINLGERAGSGLPKIRQAWEPEGGALHLLDSFEPYDQTRLEMTWGTMKPGVVSEKTSEKILTVMRKNRRITIAELADLIGVTGRTIERNIQKLQRENLLRRVGADKGGHWEVLDD